MHLGQGVRVDRTVAQHAQVHAARAKVKRATGHAVSFASVGGTGMVEQLHGMPLWAAGAVLGTAAVVIGLSHFSAWRSSQRAAAMLHA